MQKKPRSKLYEILKKIRRLKKNGKLVIRQYKQSVNLSESGTDKSCSWVEIDIAPSIAITEKKKFEEFCVFCAKELKIREFWNGIFGEEKFFSGTAVIDESVGRVVITRRFTFTDESLSRLKKIIAEYTSSEEKLKRHIVLKIFSSK